MASQFTDQPLQFPADVPRRGPGINTSQPSATPSNALVAPFYGVNYLPASGALWPGYDPAVVRADLAKIQSFGFNAARVVITASSSTGFDWPAPSPAQLANLKDFYSAAFSAGVSIHFVLFDMFRGAWGRIGAAYTYLDAVTGALKQVDADLAGIHVLEPHNEVWTAANSTMTHTGGFDAGWPAGMPHPPDVWHTALVWVQYITYRIRADAPGIPVTVSVPNRQGTASGGLGLYYNASYGTDWQPDWYDYHCFGLARDAPGRLDTALAVIGNPALMRVGECNNNVEGTSRTRAQAQAQVDTIQAVRHWCQHNGVAEPQPWMFYDQPVCAHFPSGQSDGLVDLSGNPTLAGDLYRTYPPGAAIPAVS